MALVIVLRFGNSLETCVLGQPASTDLCVCVFRAGRAFYWVLLFFFNLLGGALEKKELQVLCRQALLRAMQSPAA